MKYPDNTYLACAAVWDALQEESVCNMESVLRQQLELMHTTAVPEQMRWENLQTHLRQDVKREDFTLSTEGVLDTAFLVARNDDPSPQMEQYSLTFKLTPTELLVDLEDSDVFDLNSVKIFQLHLITGPEGQYHIYFKEALLTHFLRKKVMRILHISSRFSSNLRHQAALLSALQVLKTDHFTPA
jgi:hypothetical protein